MQTKYRRCWWCRRHIKTTRLVYAPEVMAVMHATCLWRVQWFSKVFKRPRVGDTLKWQIQREWMKRQDLEETMQDLKSKIASA